MYIGITTFKERFDTHFKPLIENIKGFPAIIAVNASYKTGLCNEYRREMLKFLSNYDNISPIFYQEMRGCSKLWNDLIIHSPSDHILILNDDVKILNTEQLMKNSESHIIKHNFFKINNCFSHFVSSKKAMIELGWFDERFLGFGEEDGDIMWRYLQTFNENLPNYRDTNIENLVSYISDKNIEKTYHGKYTLFNRCFAVLGNNEYNLDCKYVPDDNGIKGTYNTKMACRIPNAIQYPYENFYLNHKNLL